MQNAIENVIFVLNDLFVPLLMNIYLFIVVMNIMS